MTTGDLDDNDTLEPLLSAFRRRWRIIVVCLLLSLAASIALSKAQQNEYTASASILFRDPGIDQQLFGFSAFSPSTDQPSQAATNIALVSLPTVESRTSAALHMSSQAVRSAISVLGVGQANLAQINATAPDPALAARIATTYAQQYVLFSQEAARAQIIRAQQFVEKQLEALPPAERYGTVGRGLQTRANDLTQLAALQTGNAEVVQPAAAPTSPSAPHTKRNAVIGSFIGLLLGVGLAFLAERFDRRIRDCSELEEAYGVGVLGAVPFSRALAMRGLGWRAGATREAFGILRARLRYFNVDHDVRSLLITSALPHEGKTTIAVNLAIAEAVAGSTSTVLVEADLRHPKLGRRLGLPAGPGLTEILTRNTNLKHALRHVHVGGAGGSNGKTAGLQPGGGFSVITAGAVPPNPIEPLESRAMIDLLSALSELFDLVILDTAPSSVVPDAIPLMRLVTGVVIVARKNVITRDAARQLRDQLTKLRVPTLGVVANEMSDDAPEYGDYVSAKQPPAAASTLDRRPHLQTSKRLADAESHRAR